MEKDALDVKLSCWDRLVVPFYRCRWSIREKWTDLQYRCQRFKRGYASCDVWELRTWFVYTLKPMLQDLRIHRTGHPEALTDEEWDEILGEMARLLDLMDIWDDKAVRNQLGVSEADRSYETEMQISEQKREAAERFFQLFSKWFWDLWD